MMLYYQTKLGCKRTSSLEDTVKNCHILIIYKSPRCDLGIKDSEPIFLHDTSPRDNTPPYPVLYIKTKNGLSGSGDTERTRSDTRTELQTDGQTDRRTDGQSDSNIPLSLIHI